ncbi:MAG TPA: hypothetical protein VKV17_09830 [Bryobacteraceae bacterium]|nr:hypothetical protein [Bryobacteraceae bacterium]
MGTEPQTAPKMEAPSKAAIAKAAGIALAVALVLLFTVVLPAEYGFDPLKTGKYLKLTGIAQAGASQPKAAVPTPAPAGIYKPQPRIYKVDSQDFQLAPGEGVEMKYHMQKGAGMVYAWKADGKLAFEFHGEPDQKPNKDYYESYELNEQGKDSSFGSFIAPTTGIHGWFWQNKGDKDVQFHLHVAGFFDSAKMFVDGKPDDVPVEDVK